MLLHDDFVSWLDDLQYDLRWYNPCMEKFEPMRRNLWSYSSTDLRCPEHDALLVAAEAIVAYLELADSETLHALPEWDPIVTAHVYVHILESHQSCCPHAGDIEEDTCARGAPQVRRHADSHPCPSCGFLVELNAVRERRLDLAAASSPLSDAIFLASAMAVLQRVSRRLLGLGQERSALPA